MCYVFKQLIINSLQLHSKKLIINKPVVTFQLVSNQ